MRAMTPFLVAAAAVCLVGCGGGDDETVAPLPEAQRFVTAADAPGSKPDPVETRETTTEFNVFVPRLTDASIDPDPDEISDVFEDGFEGAGTDTRFFGETHSSETSGHVFSSFVELGSDDDATDALDWLETDQSKPCAMTCAVQISSFDVEGIPDARGVHRVATAEDIERVGAPDERPQDDYWIAFTSGPVVYTMTLQGRPAAPVSEADAQQIASAYYERLTASA